MKRKIKSKMREEDLLPLIGQRAKTRLRRPAGVVLGFRFCFEVLLSVWTGPKQTLKPKTSPAGLLGLILAL